MLDGIKLPRLVAAVLLFGLLGGAAYFLNSAFRQGSAGSRADGQIVQLARVRKVSLPGKFTLRGELQPKSRRLVVSRWAGVVAEVRVKAGDFVSAGALVAILRSSELDQRLIRLEGNVDAAKQALRPREDELANAEKSLVQQREYLRRDLIARSDVEQTEIALETARAKAELARAQLAQQEAMLNQVRGLQRLTRLYAPVDGHIEKVVQPGAAIDEGAAVLSIASLDVLTIKLRVSGKIPAEVAQGSGVQIVNPELPGTVTRVLRSETSKNQEEKSDEIEIEVNNQKKQLRPGMAVKVLFNLQTTEEVLLVPQSSLAAHGQAHYVYKVAGGRAVRQQVVPGVARVEGITITEGLAEGDWIIVDPTKVRSGTPIRAGNAETAWEKSR